MTTDTIPAPSIPASKPVWQSKLFWLNSIATIAALLEAFKVIPGVSPDALLYGATFVAVANVIIRIWFTDQALTLR